MDLLSSGITFFVKIILSVELEKSWGLTERRQVKFVNKLFFRLIDSSNNFEGFISIFEKYRFIQNSR
jgi:hypothetical protein